MEEKKSKKACLEKKRFYFLQVGLIMALSLAFVAFEWKTFVDIDEICVLDGETDDFFSPYIPPITRPEAPKSKTKEISKPIKKKEPHVFVIGEEEPDNNVLVFPDGEDDVEPIDQEEPGNDIPTLQGPYKSYDLDSLPQFRNGSRDLTMYIDSKMPRMNLPVGEHRVYLDVLILSDGSVGGVSVKKTKGLNRTLQSNATKIIEGMPKWTPGMIVGQSVNSTVVIPIVYEVQ